LTSPLAVVASVLEPRERDALQVHLARKGFAVCWQPDGDTAARTVLEKRPEVVLLDAGLRRKNGFQVCRIVRSQVSLATVHLVLFVEPAPPAIREWARLHGADHLVAQKLGFTSLTSDEELQRLLDRVLAASAASQSSISPQGHPFPEVIE
jgi:CheY-like chemotaxis protein